MVGLYYIVVKYVFTNNIYLIFLTIQYFFQIRAYVITASTSQKKKQVRNVIDDLFQMPNDKLGFTIVTNLDTIDTAIELLLTQYISQHFMIS